jgi:hypothetical protein
MKKITLTLLLSFFISTGFSQEFEFKKSDGTLINNGDVLTYTTAGEYLNFRIKNTSTIPLDIKIKCTNLINTPGTQFELCYGGSCLDSVTANGVYPDYENLLAPGQSNPSQGDHFVNFNPAVNSIIDYVFTVYAVGAESQSITFTYRYNSTVMSVNSVAELSSLGINLHNTVIENDFSFNTTVSGKVSLVNLNGQNVGEYSFTEGIKTINLADLNTGIYIAQFQTTEGKTSLLKLLKN